MIDLTKATLEFEQYLQAEGKSPLTIKNYKNDILLFTSVIQDNPISENDFKNNYLQYFNQIFDNSLKTNSVNRKVSSIKKYISFLKSTGYISDNFSNQVKRKRNLENITLDDKILSRTEIKLIKQFLEEDIKNSPNDTQTYKKLRNKLLFFILAFCGLSITDVLGLKWDDIDFNNNCIFTSKYRINFPPGLKGLLTEYKRFQNRTRSFIYVFTKNEVSDKPLTPKTIDRIIDYITEQTHLNKKITPYSLRHTALEFSTKTSLPLSTIFYLLSIPSFVRLCKRLFQWVFPYLPNVFDFSASLINLSILFR